MATIQIQSFRDLIFHRQIFAQLGDNVCTAAHAEQIAC